MSRIDEKLERFANDVMADVGEERRILVDEVDEEIRLKNEAKESELLTEAFEIIQTALVNIDQKKNESLSRIIMGNRTRLFEKRKEILGNVYDKATAKLVAYKKTEDYKKLLVKRVNEAKDILGPGDIWVKLDHSDADLVTFVEESTGCSVELESKKVPLIGGCIVNNRSTNTIVDHAFARRLEDAKDGFIQQCRLEID